MVEKTTFGTIVKFESINIDEVTSFSLSFLTCRNVTNDTTSCDKLCDSVICSKYLSSLPMRKVSSLHIDLRLGHGIALASGV